MMHCNVRQSIVAVTPLRQAPSHDASLYTEALLGEKVEVHAEKEGWAEVTLHNDSYKGYMALSDLGEESTLTHYVRALRTFVYPGPSIKLSPVGSLLFMGQVRIIEMNGEFAYIERKYGNGFVYAAHLSPIEEKETDFVAVAERFFETPYLWGGKSELGIDCSGLVQLSLQAVGIKAPRDTGPQRTDLGTEIALDAELQRGDLVYWQGHVAIMRDAKNILHANAYHMAVASEPLVETRKRILAQTGQDIIAIKRL